MSDDAIHDAELFTVGPDEVVVTFRTAGEREVETRVGDRAVVTEGPCHYARVLGLEPETRYDMSISGAEPSVLLPAQVTTLTRPPGALLTTIATANDVHFGETECGTLGLPEEIGPVFSTEPGAEPYPEVMNGGAIDAIARLDPDAVVVKGDLTDRGTEEEYEAFLRAYTRLGKRMYHVRGNHDAMITEEIAATGPFSVELDGVTVAVLDTVRPGTDRGRVSARAAELARRPCPRVDAAATRVRAPSSLGSGVADTRRHILRHQSRRQRSAVRPDRATRGDRGVLRRTHSSDENTTLRLRA